MSGHQHGALFACGIHPEVFRDRLFSTNFAKTLGIGDNLVSGLFRMSAQSDGMALYTELLYRYFQEQFKALVIIAVQESNGKIKQFDAKHTPHVKIARAAHASAAIPVAFKSVIIDGIAYITLMVVSKTTPLLDISRVNEGMLSKALHNITPKKRSNAPNPNALLDNLGYKRSFDLKKIRDYHTLQTISLQTWDLSATDFNGADQIKRELDIIGYLDTQDFLFAIELRLFCKFCNYFRNF